MVVNEEESENPDGVRGYLEAVGESVVYVPSFYEKYIKRGIDILIFCSLVVLSSVLVGISKAIIIDDLGSVLFIKKDWCKKIF